MTKAELDKVLQEHRLWLDDRGGERADLRDANLQGADLQRADLRGADLRGAFLQDANLQRVDLRGAYLQDTNLRDADLQGVDLRGADLQGVDLQGAFLQRANLQDANLWGAYLHGTFLQDANLQGAKGLVKIMGVEVGNYYWKRIEEGFKNNDYQYRVGINRLAEGEVFASDERIMCSYPGLHFSSRSWASQNFGDRPYEARIRIPEGAQINEPWATDGKASADMIEIVQVFRNGVDVTEEIRAKYGTGEEEGEDGGTH